MDLRAGFSEIAFCLSRRQLQHVLLVTIGAAGHLFIIFVFYLA
jgi:hypothetical protein